MTVRKRPRTTNSIRRLWHSRTINCCTGTSTTRSGRQQQRLVFDVDVWRCCVWLSSFLLFVTATRRNLVFWLVEATAPSLVFGVTDDNFGEIVSLEACRQALTTNDRNGDGRLTSFEFMSFFQQLHQSVYKNATLTAGGTTCSSPSINNNNNSNDPPHSSQLADYLPGGIYHQLFLQAACLCQSYDLLNPQVCCQIPTIRVPSTPVPTATPADAEVQVYEDGYYQDVCFLMARQIQQECPTTQTAASTATPVLSAPITPAPVTNVMARAPLPPTPALEATTATTEKQQQQEQSQDANASNHGSGGGGVHWQIYLFVPILFVLMSWIVLLFVYDSRRDDQQQEQDESRQGGDNDKDDQKDTNGHTNNQPSPSSQLQHEDPTESTTEVQASYLLDRAEEGSMTSTTTDYCGVGGNSSIPEVPRGGGGDGECSPSWSEVGGVGVFRGSGSSSDDAAAADASGDDDDDDFDDALQEMPSHISNAQSWGF
jgi:hypothetical protein